MRNSLLFVFLLAFLFSCQKDSQTEKNSIDPKLFSEISPNQTGISFRNDITETYDLNFINYPYIYNGGGVSTGDINNDGLIDIYFTANKNSNKLYLNKGNFTFEDITIKAGVADMQGWSTGTSFVDINNDGWLDIYVCKSAALNAPEQRRNKLFINQKDNTFKEEAAKYGLDHPGFSTQAYFFDFDKDDDLDMYLLNHRADFHNNSRINTEIQKDIQEESSDHFFRNDNGTFTKISTEAGIVNKAWGLSASVGDFNNDDWPDIYVANDYLEPDFLYINNKDGTFTDEVLKRMNHISFYSMGSDFADINNDLKPDLLVLDMQAEDHVRGKENMATMSTENFRAMVRLGYHHQYMANVLQVNNGNGSFNDLGQMAGITNTDWSWAPLIADFDNDGFKDVFVTNGIEKDITNQDFKTKVAEINQKQITISLDSVLSLIPGDKLSNYAFKNNGDLTFIKSTPNWGLDKKVNSSGAAYADLDNDGDLDLIINNTNDRASIYQNNSTANSVSIKLNGNELNKFSIGAQVEIHTDDGIQLQELYTNRGFISSVSNILTFGVGERDEVKKIRVIWPDNKISVLSNIKTNQLIEVNNKDAITQEPDSTPGNELLTKVSTSNFNLNYQHKENYFDDFTKQVLLPQKLSTPGPCIAVGDVNGDTLDDIILGGAHRQSTTLYLQNSEGNFDLQSIDDFTKDKNYEDTGCLLIDIDNDGDLDLYITSGGYEFEEFDALLQDRLYVNDGKGNFKKSNGLPIMLFSTKAVEPIDFDNDGDQDLIVGGNLVPGKYPESSRSFILENQNGNFVDVTERIAPDLTNGGMIYDIEVADYNNDNQQDIIVVGHWMPISFFKNTDGTFAKDELPDFDDSHGWYFSITSDDFDNDGDTDFVVGNLGKNNKFHPSKEKPLHIFSGFFDEDQSYDMALSKIYNGELVPVRGKECSTEQTPFLEEKISSYKEFASLNIEGIYGEETISSANKMKVYNFSSLFLENLGEGNFKTIKLPNEAQVAPTMDFEILDLNDDGFKDIIGVGNLYDAEVETVRYDASEGYVLLGNSNGQFKPMKNSGLVSRTDMRSVSQISIAGQSYILIANNNDGLTLFKCL